MELLRHITRKMWKGREGNLKNGRFFDVSHVEKWNTENESHDLSWRRGKTLFTL